MTGNALVLDQLADAADKGWAGKLTGTGLGPATQPMSFRGLYAFLYRNYSAAAHPSLRGLNPVIEEITQTRKRVVLERPYEGPSSPYGMATVIYALALYVASESLGWPVGGGCRGGVRKQFHSHDPARTGHHGKEAVC